MNSEYEARYPLDDEMQSFLSRCASVYPQESGQLSVEENRKFYTALCALFTFPLPDDISVSNEALESNGRKIPVRHYTPADTHCNDTSKARVIYYHGGGFVVGNLESHDSICADLASESGCQVTAVDYRLSPEFCHPAAFDDALAAFQLLSNDRTIVAGDSAGGTLAAAVCAATRNNTIKPLGQVLIYPWLGGDMLDLESYNQNADAPGLTRKDLNSYRDLRTHSNQSLCDHTYYPLALQEYSNMPPCIAFAAEFDPLKDDSGEFVSRLDEAGVYAENHVEAGLIHGYLRARRMSAKASRSFSKICAAIGRLANR
ncbi:MAG: alpha/beta hydrolase [Acidiferrobacterales bacterium]|nr:alpha/beta hydrolase [Acidiferrobacterales bacterium]